MTRRICILCLLGTGLLLAAGESDETYGLKNGRFWNHLPSDVQPSFLVGTLEGWRLRQSRETLITVKEIKAFTTSARFTTGDLADMLTSVYGDPENLELPIGWVIMACYAVQRGETTREAVFMALRKHLSNELQRKDAHPVNEVDPIDIIRNSRPK